MKYTTKAGLLVVTMPSETESRSRDRKSVSPHSGIYRTPTKNRTQHRYGKVKNKVVISPITPDPSPDKNSIAGTSRSTGTPISQMTTSTQGTRSSRKSAKSAEVRKGSGQSVVTHMSSHTTKTAGTYQRKSRLPGLLKFKKKGNKKHRENKTKNSNPSIDHESEASDLTTKSKSALLGEFSTLMNEFPTEDTLNTTLHVACAKRYSDSLIVDQLIAKGPTAVSMRNEKRDLPLHSAMKCTIETGVDERVFDELVKIYADGVKAVNRENCLPIHSACRSGGRNIYAIKKLLEAYPVSAIMKCDLKLPFDDRAFDYMHASPDRPKSAQYANDDRLDAIEESEAIDASENCATTFWSKFLMLSPKSSFESDSKVRSPDPGMESDFGPLHLAVLFGAPPDVIEAIITTNPKSLALKTDQGRRALDCGRFAIAGKKNRRPKNLSILRVPSHDDDEDEARINTYIRNIDADPVQNIFAAIEILKTFEDNQRKRMQLASATTMTAQSLRDVTGNKEFDAKKEWKKLSNIIRITRAFKLSENKLGRNVPSDANKAIRPRGYQIPDHLNHVCIDIKIPVGFRRLRWALLSSASDFEPVEVLQNKLNYSKVEMGPWDKHDEGIGCTNVASSISENSFVGAVRKCQYLMPKSGMVGANMAYETRTIVDYNEYAFVTMKVARNPEVPFGKTFECHVQTTFVNLGNNSCRMIASVEARFVGRPPMVAWKIKNAMYNGVTDFFVARGETICEHAFQECANADEDEEGLIKFEKNDDLN